MYVASICITPVRTYLRIKETESNLIKVDKRKRKLEKIIYNIDN